MGRINILAILRYPESKAARQRQFVILLQSRL
jgi:hypothetical protein